MRFACGRATQQLPLPLVAREAHGPDELLARLRRTPAPGEQVAADTGQQVVAGEGGLGGEGVDDREPLPRPLGHRHGDRAVELDDG
ncbi:hypothetical protein BKI49_15670 [Streptomyces sp. Tue6028]|nr:hypothetical protein BKI49_15670 [Streptomyces sp. Tue6028]